MTIEVSEQPKILCDGFYFTECPRWHVERLYFADMHGQAVFSVTEAGEVTQECIVEGRPGGIGFAPNGDLLVNEIERARTLRRSSTGEMTVYADSSALVPAINDLIALPDGRCYAGLFSHSYPAPKTPLIAIDSAGRVSFATDDKLDVANGMVLAAGNRRLIVAESGACRLSVFDVDEQGGLSNWRVFAQLPPEHFPDGICGDDAGGIWVACVTGKFVRVVEGGQITHRLTLAEGRFAYACGIGGADGRTLFLCTGGPPETSAILESPKARIETIAIPLMSAWSSHHPR